MAAARAGRSLILCMSVSLDGFVARRDGVIDWLDAPGADSSGADRHRAVLELLGQIDTIVLGRGAYEDMSRGWPGSESPMGELMNTLPKVVFSNSLDGVDWNNASLNRGAVQAEIPKLKQQPGRDVIAFGGARFAHALARYRLVNEYRLTVHPVALGDGLPLLHGLPEPQRLKLISSTVYPDGSVTQAFKAPV